MQRPTEEFFAESFGLPLTMNPKFEDLSCEMIFGQARPAFLGSYETSMECKCGCCVAGLL